jgi:hypothetical protein
LDSGRVGSGHGSNASKTTKTVFCEYLNIQ